MNIIESLRVALSSLWANKMRSFLTMLGIIIGIASVITIVALGQGSQAEIGNEFEKFGTNRLYFRMSWNSNPKYRDRFDDSDIEAIKRVFGQEIKGISPVLSLSAEASKGRENKPIYFYGVNDEYNQIDTSFDIIKGRFLLESDLKSSRNVGVINEKLAKALFKRTDVLGEKILIDTGYTNVSLTIIGVYKTEESTLSSIAESFGEQPTILYVPVSAIQKMGYGNRYYSFEVNIRDGSKVQELSEDIIKLIERRHRNIGEDFYMSQSAQQEMQMVDNVLGILSNVVGAIAAISLLVGGIGVMNIMLVSVTERTREIGIRKAIGAKRRDILIQFLVESMIISATGGLIGTTLGLGVANAIALAMGFPPSVSIITIIIAVSFSSVIGIFFGIYPANKAAKLDPIDALRYE